MYQFDSRHLFISKIPVDDESSSSCNTSFFRLCFLSVHENKHILIPKKTSFVEVVAIYCRSVQFFSVYNDYIKPFTLRRIFAIQKCSFPMRIFVLLYMRMFNNSPELKDLIGSIYRYYFYSKHILYCVKFWCEFNTSSVHDIANIYVPQCCYILRSILLYIN